MREIDFQHIPAVARRIAFDELTNQLSALEAELANEKSAFLQVEKELASVRAELDSVRSAEAERAAQAQMLTSTLARISEEAEVLRVKLSERDSSARASEEVRTEIEARLADTERELESRRLEEAQRIAEIAKLQSVMDESVARARASEEARASVEAQLEVLSRKLDEMQRQAEHQNTEDEVATCRTLAEKCVFVIGFARSYTTITLEILNCASNALLLSEADFFLGEGGDTFTASYNRKHCEFRNQITKSSHAPDFLPNRPHTWWQWLESAAQFYDCVGEKLALSDYHLRESPSAAFRAFYEARFLNSRYIFMIRNPIDALLSSAKLKSVVDDQGMTRLCLAWLDFMQLWADFIRVFPRTTTIVCERFGEATVTELELFTGLRLDDARLLINPANKRRHKLTSKFPTLVRLKPQLEELYADAVEAADENRALWQAEQKRDPAANETKGQALGSIAMTSRPLGRVWLRTHELRERLGEALNKEDR